MSRGGKREGAGRKPIGPALKRRKVQIWVAGETADTIKELRTRKVDIGRLLDRWIDDLRKEFGL